MIFIENLNIKECKEGAMRGNFFVKVEGIDGKGVPEVLNFWVIRPEDKARLHDLMKTISRI